MFSPIEDKHEDMPRTIDMFPDQQSKKPNRLMEALLSLGYVKVAHEGTRRMRGLMVESGLCEPRSDSATWFVAIQ